MSKPFIRPLTVNSVHKPLCTKYIPPRKPTELTEAFDRYRNENQAIYKQKCDLFLAGVKQYHDDNYDILIRHKSSQRRRPTLTCQCNLDINCGDIRVPDLIEKEESKGQVYRRRTKRYFYEKPVIDDKVCGIEPWLKRYFVLNRFIEAVRKVILRNRMMKRLAKLKVILSDPMLLKKDELLCPLRKEYLSYPELSYFLENL